MEQTKIQEFSPAKYVDKTGNQVNVIFPRRTPYGVWVFDDAEVGLQAEPFVGVINRMIDAHVDGKKECTVYISKDPLPDATLSLTNVDEKLKAKEKEEFLMQGYYQLDGTEMIGWLCPATLHYFKDYPQKIYAKIETK